MFNHTVPDTVLVPNVDQDFAAKCEYSDLWYTLSALLRHSGHF